MHNKYKVGKIRTDNRAKIIAIAEMEFAEFGYKGASIMNIAKRANLPRANVHYYFNSKLELYKKVLFDILKLWNDAFNQITPEDDPAEAIGAYIRAKVMYSKTNPLASKIFANEIIHGAPRISEYLNSDFRDWLVEAINTFDIPRFFLSNTQQALKIIEKVGSDNLSYQYDIYHMQRMEGELSSTIQNQLSSIGHLQLADNPGRHEPGSGEINYDFLLNFIDKLGYKGWIGAEYVPADHTEQGLGWIKQYI